MMTMTKKDMMTTKVMATELMTLTFGLIQIELSYAAEYIESKLVEFDPSNASDYESSRKA
jgi:hypothetical protein